MTRSYPKSSQIANDSALETLGVSAETPLNTLFDKLAQEVESPYRLHAALVPDSKLYINESLNAMANNTKEVCSVGHIGLISFSSGYIDFQARAYSANITISFPSSTVGQYRLCVLSVLPDGSVQASFTAENATLGNLADPLTVVPVNNVLLGWIQLECTNTSGSFKTAGSTTNIIENSVGGTSRIHHFTDKSTGRIYISSGVNPTATDDAYKIGTIWADQTSKRSFLLLNNAADAADWREFIYNGGNESAISLGTNTSASLTLKTNNTEAGVIDNAQTWSIGPVAGGVIHTVRGALTVNGDLTVTGTTTTVNSTVVEVADNEIKLNKGEVGAGVTAGQAGILIDRGSETNYEFVFRESDDLFRIGLVGATQAVATREDTPLTNGVSFWNATAYRFDTDTGFTYNPSTNMLSAANITTDEITFGTTTFKLGTFDGTNFRISSSAGIFCDFSTTAFSMGRATTVHTLLGTEVKLFDSAQAPKLTFDSNTGAIYYFKRIDTPSVAFQLCSYESAVAQEHMRINAKTNIELGQDANLIHKIRGTGALAIPSGTTTNRDALTPAAGIIRWSTTGSVIECYTGSAWKNMATETYALAQATAFSIVFG